MIGASRISAKREGDPVSGEVHGGVGKSGNHRGHQQPLDGHHDPGGGHRQPNPEDPAGGEWRLAGGAATGVLPKVGVTPRADLRNSASRSTSRASASATDQVRLEGGPHPTCLPKSSFEPHEAAGPPIPEERARFACRTGSSPIAGGEIPARDPGRPPCGGCRKTVLRAHARPGLERLPPGGGGVVRGGLRPPSLRRPAGSRTVPPAAGAKEWADGPIAEVLRPRSSTSGCGGIETREPRRNCMPRRPPDRMLREGLVNHPEEGAPRVRRNER